jgi:zinc-ribbon domain
MFCPKCASQNLEGASFCRVCGANISLVPQALSGQLPQQQSERELSRAERRQLRRHGREASLDSALRSAFMGIGFLFVAIALSFSGIGRGWWFWMLIPAFSMMGTGIAQYIRLKEQQKQNLAPPPIQPAFQPPPRVTSFPRRNTGELAPQPPSVTEGTTRHLGAEAQTRHLDTSEPNNN